MLHISVLLHEAVDALQIQPGDSILDGTVGAGGHSQEIIKSLQGKGLFLGIDLDAGALERVKVKLNKDVVDRGSVQIHLREGNYADMEKIATEAGAPAFDGILLDLGLSSDQLETSGRGFSFKNTEPLLMTFRDAKDAGTGFTAREILNEWEESTLADIFFGYGEERFARPIARTIVETRKLHPLETTDDLVGAVLAATPTWYHRGRIHPATKVFQALRIAVNEEMESLRRGLAASVRLLRPKGRLAVITFHSIEDRIVKVALRTLQAEGKGTVLTKKPITPTQEEVTRNPRARSAKLRVFEKADLEGAQP